MSEMVKIVAKAIQDAMARAIYDAITKFPDFTSTESLARAAIAAMREPPRETALKMQTEKVIWEFHHGTLWSTWEAMIDEALKERK